MKHELSGGAFSVDSRGKDAHLRDPPAPTSAPPMAFGVDSFGAPDMGIQGKWEPWWWPLTPGPRHFLAGALTPMAEGKPFLRWKRVRILLGSLSILYRGEPADRIHCSKMEQGPGRRRSEER